MFSKTETKYKWKQTKYKLATETNCLKIWKCVFLKLNKDLV